MPVQNEDIPNSIRLTDFEPEGHVLAAFRKASALAGDAPISAADLLRAIHIALREDVKSKAFDYLVSLLPLDNVPTVTADESISDFPVSTGLAESYSVAQKLFSTTSNIWGRDLVSLALLAEGDPSLNEIASEAGTTVDQLQDAWFEFVTSSEQHHRTRQEWTSWWKEAGVPLPEERSSIADSTYLFTWNPDRFDEAEIEKIAEEISNSGPTLMKWSTGTRRHVAPGERVFLIRQGVDPRGLVGSGRIEGGADQVPHWDPEKRKQGKQSWIAPVVWDTLSTTPIIPNTELSQETGESALWRTQAGGVKIRPDLAATLEQLWSEATGDVSSVTEAFRFAQTLSDLDHKNDWIGIRPDVEALSTLVAVNRVEPPLSVAIFGDWGSGKTFLMQKIRERVQLLEGIGKTQEDQASTEADGIRYCSSILQIEFNAWHYIESNLWASLVNHIFDELHERLSPIGEDDQQEEAVEKLFEQFEMARRARKSAQRQIDLLSAEVTLARNNIRAEETQANRARRNLSRLLGQTVWNLLDEELDENDQEFKDLKNALKHFGFEESLASAQTIYDTVGRFRSVSGRAREVFGSLLATEEGVYGAVIVALVVFIATIVAAIEEVPILSIGTAFAGILGWLAERARSADDALKKIQSFDAWFSKRKQEQESRLATSLENAKTLFEQRKEALSLAKQHLAEAETREARAKEDLKQLTAREQIRRFVDERVTTQAYAKHLGLISMIRGDFELLSFYMSLAVQAGQINLLKRVSKEIQEAIPKVERIVLYIDDLDRCQPERVVEVLEAIHLLLAFRLFIVVVAVDPRWVIESLGRRYPHLSEKQLSQRNDKASPSQNKSNARVHLEATAHDYLEKIFHIPFWVKPMGPNASKSLIAGYLGFAESDSEDTEKERQREDERFHDLIIERSAQASSIADHLPIEPEESGAAEERTPASRYSEQTYTRLESERRYAERKLENVVTTADEQAFIRELARHLGNSPRRIKRYANTYRLLKSGLTRQEARLFTTGTSSGDDYKIVLVFLAIVTGAPSLSPLIFSRAFAMRSDFDIDTLIQEAGLKDKSADPFDAANAIGALELLRGLQISSEKIETWIPRVMRYAFRLTPVSLVAA